jgi:drug/metabolite transporter (DMT)-like permease
MFVIVVPMLSALGGKAVRPVVWLAAGLALAGTGMLSFDGGPPNRGDAWTLLTALTWGIYIHRLGGYADKISTMPLTAIHLWGVVLFSAISTAAVHHAVAPVPWGALIYLGVAATALTTLVQSAGQRSVAAPQAAIIFMLEPVFASLFAYIFNGTRLGGWGFAGAALILSAAAMSQLPTLLGGRADVATA